MKSTLLLLTALLLAPLATCAEASTPQVNLIAGMAGARAPMPQVKDAEWFTLRVVVDFTSGLNRFPDLTLLDLLPASYADSVVGIDDVLAKMKLAGVTNAVIATHMTPEFGATPEQVEASFKRGLRDLCRRAKECGIILHLQNQTGRWHGNTPEVLRLIDDVFKDVTAVWGPAAKGF